MRQISLNNRFFFGFGFATVITALGYVAPTIIWLSAISFFGLGLLLLVDLLFLFVVVKPVKYVKHYQEKLSLGDQNPIKISLTNVGKARIWITVYEGFPMDMQARNTHYDASLNPLESIEITYDYIPKKRGVYTFTDTYIFTKSIFGLLARRTIYPHQAHVHVYPSILQMKRFEQMLFQQNKLQTGIRRVRKIGMSREFEQIRTYVPGDEIKSINWKATSRKNELMVNQYQEEKSQNVYCIIDKGRIMQMESLGLTMLDYAINSTLVLSNICLHKSDKIGLFTFSDKLGTTLPASNKRNQLKKILDQLYAQKTTFQDSNFELLQQHISDKVRTRSLLLLFTNFENPFTLQRSLPYLLQLKKRNLLVVVLFRNEELEQFSSLKPDNQRRFYQGVLASKTIIEKEKMAKQLNAMGIQTILTKPEELSTAVINKYLSLKAKGLL
ncbi:MAG: DUF58 domain-containing protein [Crocinitomicaceae bacterium]|nr:DUF58 domain-containing protein [Crocinitomicaceae bacterium]